MRKSIIVFLIPVILTLVFSVAYANYVTTNPGPYIRAEVVNITTGVMDINPDEYMKEAIENPGERVYVPSIEETNLIQKAPRDYIIDGHKRNGWLIKYNEAYYFFSGLRVDAWNLNEGGTTVVTGILSVVSWPVALVIYKKRQTNPEKIHSKQ